MTRHSHDSTGPGFRPRLTVGEDTVDPAACVGCDECVRVCPENVVAPSRRLQDATPVQLTTVVTHRCTSCGMPLSPGETGGCSACSARRSLVSDVWAQYGL